MLMTKVKNILKIKRKSDIELNSNDFSKITGFILFSSIFSKK